MKIGQTNTIRFQVNVMGTSAAPTVRLILSTTPELSFPAKQDGTDWVVTAYVPENVQPGSVDARIEVIVNNRHFTPLTKRIELMGPANIPAVPYIQDTTPQQEEISAVVANVPEAAEPVQDVPAATPTPVTETIKKNVKLPSDLFASITAQADTLSIQAQPVVTNEAVFTAMDKPLPKKKTVKQPIIELKHSIPTRLVKGEVIYE